MKKLVICLFSLIFIFQTSLLSYSTNPKNFVDELINDVITKLSDKDLRDWENFVKSKDRIISKDDLNKAPINKNKNTFKIDLHGLSLDQANKFIEKTVNECFEKNVSRINVITGKGMRSKSAEDPYKSSELSILKHSVPEFINSNLGLMKLIKKIDNKDEKNSGSFNIYLKSKNKFG